MSEECTHDCGSCSQDCAERQKTDFLEKPHPMSSIKKVIGVVSGKGGVGKSLVTSLLAVMMNRKGYHSAILDADLTGPSIPKACGIKEKATGTEDALFPVTSKTGIDIMSLNLLLENDTDPVVWRGPIIAGTVKQFWTDVIWKDVDYMFVDMPPGTGDVPLTVFQSLPLEGCEHGAYDGYSDSGPGGEYELCAVPGLREGNSCVRRKPYRRDRPAGGPESSGQAAHRSQDRRRLRRRGDRGCEGEFPGGCGSCAADAVKEEKAYPVGCAFLWDKLSGCLFWRRNRVL